MSYVFFWELRGNCLGIVWELFGNCLGIVWEFSGIILKLRELLSKTLYFYNHF